MNLTRTIHIATEAHNNPKDEVGKPDIMHVMRVMERCKTEEEKIVEILSDLIEDTSIIINDLRQEGFKEKILAVV